MTKEQFQSFKVWFLANAEDLAQLTPQFFSWVGTWGQQLARLATVARQEGFELETEEQYLEFVLWKYGRDLDAGQLCSFADRESGR